MKKRLMLVFIFTLLLSLMACSGTETKKEELEKIITIEPVDLFSGNAAKFQPFLGNFSGAVHVKYAGEMKLIEAKLDIWENGEKTKAVGNFGIPLIEKNGQYKFDHEVIISVNEFNYEGETSYYIIKTALVEGFGASSSQIRLEKDEKYTGFSTLTLQEPIQVAENEPALVWGMQATDKNFLRTIDLTEESLAQTDWALVLTIELSDESM